MKLIRQQDFLFIDLELMYKYTRQVALLLFPDQGIDSNRFDGFINNNFIFGVEFFHSPGKSRSNKDRQHCQLPNSYSVS